MATGILRIIIVSNILGYMLVNGRATGAPQEACEDGTNMVPNHVSNSPSTSPVPYSVDISGIPSTGYIPGQNYNITLRAADQNFRGFMIQGRVRADDSPTGTFGSGNNYQPQCSGNTAATHTASTNKRTVNLLWTAPPAGTGCVRFRYAFVNNFTTFWANLMTPCVNEVPQTQIRYEASGSISGNNFTISLNATGDGEFECSLDGGLFQSCSSGDVFPNLSVSSHIMTIWFTPDRYCQSLMDQLSLDFSIVMAPAADEFSVTASATYSGDTITVSYNVTAEAICTCQLDSGSPVSCDSGHMFNNVPQREHNVTVICTSTDDSSLTATSTVSGLQFLSVNFALKPSGTSITVIIQANIEATHTCRLNDGPFVDCFSDFQFQGISGGSHTVTVESTSLNGLTMVTTNGTTTVRGSDAILITDIKTGIDVEGQIYNFTFNINEKVDDLTINLLIDGSLSLVPFSCFRVSDEMCFCTLRIPNMEYGFGSHNITFQGVLNGQIRGSTTSRLLVTNTAVVRFKDAAYSVVEGNEMFTAVIEKVGSNAQQLTLSVRIDGETATRGSDFPFLQLGSQRVEIEPGPSRDIPVNFTVTDDDTVECNETFRMRLFSLSGNLLQIDPTLGETVVTIIDDDDITVGFVGMRTITEGDTGFVEIAYQDIITQTFNVTVESYHDDDCNVADPATPGVDYEPVNVALTFTPSTQSQTINIVTLEDGMYEADGQPERICLRITKLSEPCPDSSIIGDDVIVLIAEDDPPQLILRCYTNTTGNSIIGWTVSVFYTANTELAPVFRCALNSGDLQPCDDPPPKMYGPLSYGDHTVKVEATTPFNDDIVIIIYQVLMVQASLHAVGSSALYISIQSTKDATYRCRLNDGLYFQCNDGDVIPNLPPIMYNLSVEATPEGNTEYDLRFASNIVGPVTLTNCSVQCPPVVAVHPESSDVPLRRSITLTCRASGIRTLAYSWERSSGSSWTTVSNDNTTSYTTDTTLATGQYMYRCRVRVSNEAGSVVSNNTIVNVYGPPTIKIQLTDKLIIFNTTTTLTCRADGDGIITYQWYKRKSVERNPWVMISNNNNSVFVTERLQDSSEFRCTVSNEAGHSRSCDIITVLKITTHPEDKLVAVHSTVSLTCTSSLSSNVIFSWTHNGRSINGSSTTDDTSILTITSVRHSDAGSYVCTVRSGSLSVMSNVAILTVYDPPVVTDHPGSSDVPLRGSVTLRCSATAVGTLVYSWERSSGGSWITVSNDNTTSYTTDTTLAIGQYMYRCRVSNEAGSVVSNIATVNVYALRIPQMYVHPHNKSVEVNNDSTSITFICMAYEASSYFWLRETGDIPSDGTGIKSNNLTLHNILPSDSGRYQCVAVNGHGKTYSNYAVLTVKALPPVVKIISEIEVNARKGERVEFVCSATGVGSDDFLYRWFLNDLRVADQDTPTLVIGAVSENDTGDYKCFVRNQYDGIGQSEVAKLTLDQFCNPVIVNYSGFNVTWSETQAGITVEVPCTGHGLNGTVRRRCIKNHLWEESFDCFRQETSMLLHQATNLTIFMNELNETETIAVASNIANALVNVTTPTQEPIFAQDINLAVDILSTLNNVTETFVTNLTVNDTFFEDTASVINNLLNVANQDSWKQLERTSPSTSQDLVSGAEQITKLLSETLTNDATEAIKTRPNIIIKAERVSNDSIQNGYVFPDEDDNLTAYSGGNALVMVSSGLLQNITTGSKELTIASTVIRNNSGLRLPSSNYRPDVPVSPIFSLQINPLPDLRSLVENPIMMMFDVDHTAALLEQSSIPNERNFTVNDLSCNFYDHTLVTDDNLNQIGGWSTEGLTVDKSHSNKTLVTCLTRHLTSFAVLVSIQDERPPSPADKALSIISYIGCSVSLVCLCVSIIFLTYTIYKVKDNKNHLFIHLNLCIALALGLVVFIGGIENATVTEGSCKFVAVLLQYLFISAFCWMLCEGIFLYMMLVTVFGNKLNNRRFFFVLGWGPAIPIVAISAGIAHKHYGTDYYCWIKSDDGAIAAFIVPIVAIMLINCIFLAITLKVLWQQIEQKAISRHLASNKDTVKNVLKAAVILLPLLGITWIIGILAVNNDTQVFAWIFAILNSLQGVFIFVLHVIRNKQVAREIRECYNFMRRSKVFSGLASIRGSGSTGTGTSEISSKAKISQGTPKNISTVSTTGGDYSSKTIEISLKDKSEDGMGDQIKLTIFKKAEEAIIDDVVNKEPIEEERKSITEEDGAAIVAERSDPAAIIKE